MTRADDPVARAVEIGQRVSGHPELVDEVLPELAALMAEYGPVVVDDAVLEATIDAIGQAWDERAVALLLPLTSGRPLPVDVRFSLACALPRGVESEPLLSAVIDALVPLTADEDDDVRDWACFGLGQLEADTAAVREALAARLEDPHEDTRCEALVSLAKTGDPRALAEVTARLSGDLSRVCSLELRAAAELADPVLLPTLDRVVAARLASDNQLFTDEVEFAVERCAADNALLAVEVEKRLLVRLRAQLDPRLTVGTDGRWPRTNVQFHDHAASTQVWSDRLWDEVAQPDDLDLEQTVASYLHTVHTQLFGGSG